MDYNNLEKYLEDILKKEDTPSHQGGVSLYDKYLDDIFSDVEEKSPSGVQIALPESASPSSIGENSSGSVYDKYLEDIVPMASQQQEPQRIELPQEEPEFPDIITPVKDALKKTGYAAGAGLATGVAAMYDAGSQALRSIPYLGDTKPVESAADYIQSFGTPLKKLSQDLNQKVGEYSLIPGTANAFSSSVPSLLTSLLVGKLASPSNPLPSPSVTAGTLAAQPFLSSLGSKTAALWHASSEALGDAGGTYKDTLDKTGDRALARQAANLQLATELPLNTAADMLGYVGGGASNLIGGKGRGLLDFAADAASNAFQEIGTDIIESSVNKSVGKDTTEYLKNLLDTSTDTNLLKKELATTGAYSAGSSAIMAGLGLVGGKFVKRSSGETPGSVAPAAMNQKVDQNKKDLPVRNIPDQTLEQTQDNSQSNTEKINEAFGEQNPAVSQEPATEGQPESKFVSYILDQDKIYKPPVEQPSTTEDGFIPKADINNQSQSPYGLFGKVEDMFSQANSNNNNLQWSPTEKFKGEIGNIVASINNQAQPEPKKKTKSALEKSLLKENLYQKDEAGSIESINVEKAINMVNKYLEKETKAGFDWGEGRPDQFTEKAVTSRGGYKGTQKTVNTMVRIQQNLRNAIAVLSGQTIRGNDEIDQATQQKILEKLSNDIEDYADSGRRLAAPICDVLKSNGIISQHTYDKLTGIEAPSKQNEQTQAIPEERQPEQKTVPQDINAEDTNINTEDRNVSEEIKPSLKSSEETRETFRERTTKEKKESMKNLMLNKLGIDVAYEKTGSPSKEAFNGESENYSKRHKSCYDLLKSLSSEADGNGASVDSRILDNLSEEFDQKNRAYFLESVKIKIDPNLSEAQKASKRKELQKDFMTWNKQFKIKAQDSIIVRQGVSDQGDVETAEQIERQIRDTSKTPRVRKAETQSVVQTPETEARMDNREELFALDSEKMARDIDHQNEEEKGKDKKRQADSDQEGKTEESYDQPEPFEQRPGIRDDIIEKRDLEGRYDPLMAVINKLREIAPVRKGANGPKGVLGYAHRIKETARLKAWNDWRTAFHEIGHILDMRKNWLAMTKNAGPIERELITIGVKTSPKNVIEAFLKANRASQAYRQAVEYLRAEGIAEYMTIYAENSDLAEAAYPNYSKFLKQELEKDTALRQTLSEAWDLARQYNELSAEEKLTIGIIKGYERGEQKPSFHDTVKRIVFNWKASMTDQYQSLLEIEKMIHDRAAQKGLESMFQLDGKDNVPLKDRPLKDMYAPYRMARTMEGYIGKVKSFVSDIFSEIRSLGVDNYNSLLAYMKAEAAMDYWNNGMEPGTGDTKENTEKFIEDFKAKHPDLVKKAETIRYRYNKMVEDTLVSSGIMKGVNLEKLRKKYPNYIPFLRVDEDGRVITPSKAGKNFVNLSNQMKQRKGMPNEWGYRPIADPIESMVDNARIYYKVAEKNRVGKAIVNAALSEPRIFSGLVEPISGAGEKTSEQKIWVYVNGERQYFQVSKPIFDALQEIEATHSKNAVVNLLNTVSRFSSELLKLTTTRYSPVFAVRNFIRDSVYSSITSEAYTPPIFNTIKGISAQLADDPKTQRYIREAIDNGIVGSGLTEIRNYANRDDVAKAIRKIIDDPGFMTKAGKAFDKIFGRIGTANEMVEVAPKIHEYIKIREQGYSKRYAALKAREVNVDFSKGGTLGKKINQHVAFFNPAIQGVSKAFQTAVESPGKTALKATLFVMLPSLIEWFAYKDDDEYRQMSRNIKDRYWLFKSNGTWVRISKPETFGLLGSFAERLLDGIYLQDPMAFDGFGHSVAEALTPSLIPTLAAPALEVSMNKDFFRGSDLIPRSLENLPEKYQYDKNTSEISKYISEILSDKLDIGVSPIVIDHLASGYLGSIGDIAVHSLDVGKEKRELSEAPFVSSFTADPDRNNKYIGAFYDLREKSVKAYNEAKQDKALRKRPKSTSELKMYDQVTSAARAIAELNREITKTDEMPLTPEARRIRNDRVRKKKIDIARRVMDRYFAFEGRRVMK